MKITTRLSAALAAATLSGLAASTAHAAPARDDGGYVNRVVRSPNGKDVFVRVVRVPRTQSAATRDGPEMDAKPCAPPQAARPKTRD